MNTRFMQDLPEGVTVATQCEFLMTVCDDMIKQTGWVRADGDVTITVTARRLVRFLEAAKEELLGIMTDPTQHDPELVWTPRSRQALLWAIGVETPINFEEGLQDG